MSACDGRDPPQPGDTQRGASASGPATIENGLAYDGCSYPITVEGVEYAPSPATQPLAAAAAQASGRTHVVIDYLITGGTAEVECGWGSRRTLPEIELLAVGEPGVRATIEAGLPYDGCSYPVTIDGVEYTPSAATLQRVTGFITRAGKTDATITYAVTGAVAEVECGWGTRRSLPEIDVLTIAP